MCSKLDNQRISSLKGLCKVLGIDLNDLSLLNQALIHTSFANETKGTSVIHNERLEFLGDAVLDLVISEYLFRQFPNLPEGELTKARAAIVCEATIARRAASLSIGKYLLLGKGELVSGGRERISILADAFEAIIGAIYLDGGFESAKSFVIGQLKDQLALVETGDYVKDYKTLLQEVVQRNSDSRINYEIIAERGPDHDKTFEIEVLVNSKQLGIGLGKSKKEAEQQAAKQALNELNSGNF